jgi:hypothetical protein
MREQESAGAGRLLLLLLMAGLPWLPYTNACAVKTIAVFYTQRFQPN